MGRGLVAVRGHDFGKKMKSVAYVYPFSFHYRAPFNERLRRRLEADGVRYDFIYSADPKFTNPRGDAVEIPWATSVPCSKWMLGRMELRYQHALRIALQHDLIIVQQENGLLLNYLLLVGARLLGKKTAYFGHGKNFQTRNPNGFQERFKRFWLDKVDWWFAYTDLAAEVVADAGYPKDRITVFNNAIDTSTIKKQVAGIDPNMLANLRRDLVEGSENVGVYVGGLYHEKRVSFLLEAADRLRQSIPDFHLIVIGAGSDDRLVREAAQSREWVHYLGPKFGAEKTTLVCLGKAFLMPGLVGLAVLDAFAYGVPLVTTSGGLHSPEICYLEDGRNGIMVQSAQVSDYVEAVARLMRDDEYRRGLVERGRYDSARYTIEAMVDRFADGVMAALVR